MARISDTADERAIRLTLTPAGRELIERVLPDHVALVRDLFIDRLGSAELATVRASLAKVARG